MAQTRRLTEYADNRGVVLRVDRESSVIKGVKVLGLDSKNGRSYTREAVSQAAKLYEGKSVNVDHLPKGKGNEARSYASRIGHLEGIEVKADGLYGNLHFNPKHQLAEQLAYDAEHAPHRVGLSHNVEGQTATKNGKLVVEAITAVASVDVVADPATTNSLYEAEGDMEGEAAPVASTETAGNPVDALIDALNDEVSALFKSDDDASTKIAKFRDFVKKSDQVKNIMNKGSDKKPADKPAEDKPADNAPKTEALEIKVKHLEEQLALRDKRETVALMIREAKLPERLATEILTEALLSAKDEAAQKKILEERKTLARELSSNRPRSVDANRQSLTESVKDTKSFVHALTH